MKWKKQLCAAAAVLLALGIALAGVLLNQHFLVLSGGISRTEIQSPLGDWVRSHLQLVALIVFATLAAPSWPFTTIKSSRSCAIFSSIWQFSFSGAPW